MKKFKIAVLSFFILCLIITTGCMKQPEQTMWYQGRAGTITQITNDQNTIKNIKNKLNQISWNETKPSDTWTRPKLSFWIGRNKDNVRIINCEIWQINSDYFVIYNTGVEADLSNNYAGITQTDFDQILKIIGISKDDI